MAEALPNQTSETSNRQNNENGYAVRAPQQPRRRNSYRPRNQNNGQAERKVCSYFKQGNCKFGDRCRNAHISGSNNGREERNGNRHRNRREAEGSSMSDQPRASVNLEALERSKDKSCGICFEIVIEKPYNARFGILPNCNHCYCLSCICKWRQVEQYEAEVKRACPECRTVSDFVCPSKYWVDTPAEKEKAIKDYKDAAAKKPCKYFLEGKGRCPFGNVCFFLHALPDGTIVDLGSPRPNRPRRPHAVTLLNSVQAMDRLENIFSFVDDLDDLFEIVADMEFDLSYDDDEEDLDVLYLNNADNRDLLIW